jgi:hypothetical protein
MAREYMAHVGCGRKYGLNQHGVAIKDNNPVGEFTKFVRIID